MLEIWDVMLINIIKKNIKHIYFILLPNITYKLWLFVFKKKLDINNIIYLIIIFTYVCFALSPAF